MARRIPRRELTRIAAPLAFLAAVTIAVLLIHSALSGGSSSTSTTTTRQTTTKRTTTRQTTTAPKPPKKHRPPASSKRFYVIVSGDTFSIVAAREGTTVEKLIALNPGVDSNALSIGEKIRVG